MTSKLQNLKDIGDTGLAWFWKMGNCSFHYGCSVFLKIEILMYYVRKPKQTKQFLPIKQTINGRIFSRLILRMLLFAQNIKPPPPESYRDSHWEEPSKWKYITPSVMNNLYLICFVTTEKVSGMNKYSLLRHTVLLYCLRQLLLYENTALTPKPALTPTISLFIPIPVWFTNNWQL